MTALLSLIGPQAIAILIGIVALLGVYIKGRKDNAKLERAKQASSEARARDIADTVDNDIGTLTPEQRRERLTQWARH